MNEIIAVIDSILRESGFEVVIIDGKNVYHHEGSYYKFTYINQFEGYVVEYADNYEDAKNNVFEDGDIYSIDLNENELAEKIKADLIR